MTSLNLNGAVAAKAELGASLQPAWLKHVGLAISGASGTAVVIGAYEVIKAQPDQSFKLLQVWGPIFIVAILIVAVAGKLGGELIQAIRESFSMVATSVHDSAEASGRTADALTRLADQGGRQAEQVERLAVYAAQEFPRVYERMDEQDKDLKDLLSGVKGLHSMLSNEKAALDLKEVHDGSRS